MKPDWNFTALFEIFLINIDIPSGPNLSIIEPSIFFQKNKPIFLFAIIRKEI